jgi:hypothetical protein
VAAAEAMQLAKLRTEFPELSPPTKSMILAREGLAKLARTHPEKFGMFIGEKIIKGEISERELAEYLELLRE